MISELLNTLFVMSQNAYVRLDNDTLRVEVDGSDASRVPLHHLSGVVLFGNVMITPGALGKCAEQGLSVTFLDMYGRFKARLVGPVTGNILLRHAQYEAYSNESARAGIAKAIVAGKVQNARGNILRVARDFSRVNVKDELTDAAERIAGMLSLLPQYSDLEGIRGCEGQSAAIYFDVFDKMILQQKTYFAFSGRNRRPPRDRVNALLSFLYAVLANDCTSALEGVGLDPQLGFLHALRSGRPALSLDLMEEFRPSIAERLALSLINLRQIKPEHFEERPGGSVMLDEVGRKVVITAYQTRKQEEVSHPLLKNKIQLGLVPHLQARLLARHIRGEMEVYTPFLPR